MYTGDQQALFALPGTGRLAGAPEPTVRMRVPLRVDRASEQIDTWIYSFRNLCDLREHVAVAIPGPAMNPAPLVRVHSECLTGDVFGSTRCDCGPQLSESIERIADAGGGVVLYLRQEGRDIGLYNKIDAYRLQDDGFDTYAANKRLGLAEDARNYRVAAQMLQAMGHRRIRLFSNNPEKIRQLECYGMSVVAVENTSTFDTVENFQYLSTKAAHGHSLQPTVHADGLPLAAGTSDARIQDR